MDMEDLEGILRAMELMLSLYHFLFPPPQMVVLPPVGGSGSNVENSLLMDLDPLVMGQFK